MTTGNGGFHGQGGFTHPLQPAPLVIPPVTPTSTYVNYPLTPITTPMMSGMAQMGGFTFPAAFSVSSPFPFDATSPTALTAVAPPSGAPVTPKLDANAIRSLFAFPPLPTNEFID